MEDGGGEQEHERRCVRAVSRALLPVSAPLLSPAAPSDHVAGQRARPRPQTSTATSPEARRVHGGRKRRAEARATVCLRRRSCSAARSCPLPLARRALRPRRPTPRPRTSTATSPEARRVHGGRRRAADARATVRPRCRSCSAARSCPLALARRALRPRRRPASTPTPSNVNSDEPGGSSRPRRTEADSRCTSDGASALSLGHLLPAPALLYSPSHYVDGHRPRPRPQT